MNESHRRPLRGRRPPFSKGAKSPRGPYDPLLQRGQEKKVPPFKKGEQGGCRIGQGFDVHRLEKGDGVVLGGVRIACGFRIVAHSDGDVLIHALCDALLGAAGLGDIGRHFPDTDAKYKNADSRLLLREVMMKLGAAGWRVANADLTLIAQAPKISPHSEVMRKNIATDLAIDAGAVNIKATTSEGLGFIGREEGIAAQAVVLLESNRH